MFGRWDIREYNYYNDTSICKFEILHVPSGFVDGHRCISIDTELPKCTDLVTPSLFRWAHKTLAGKLALNEVANPDSMPLMFHPKLAYMQLLRPMFPEHSLMLIQMWSEDNWRDVVKEVTGHMEIIDKYYLSVLVSRWLARTDWIPSEHRYDVVMKKEELRRWSPPLGSLLLGNGEEFVCVINHQNKSVTLCDFKQEGAISKHLSIGEINEQRFPISLFTGDDPGQVLDWYQLVYGWSADFRNSVSVQLSDVAGADFVGGKEAVRIRRLAAVRPFLLPTKGLASPWRLSGDGANVVLNSWGRYCQGTTRDSSEMSMLLPRVHMTCDMDKVISMLSGKWLSTPVHEFKGFERSRGKSAEMKDFTFRFSITIVITTCRRLKFFLVTAEALAAAFGGTFTGTEVQEVIVIDDSSSMEDRLVMLEKYPDFTFVLKSSGAVGHAHSLNIMTRIVTSRYLIYLEDDWKYHAIPIFSNSFAPGIFKYVDSSGGDSHDFSLIWLVRSMVDIISKSTLPAEIDVETIVEPIAQILFNDQGQSECARGLLSVSHGDNASPIHHKDVCRISLVGQSGWRRIISIPFEHARAESNEVVMLEYMVHEFGLAGGMSVSFLKVPIVLK